MAEGGSHGTGPMGQAVRGMAAIYGPGNQACDGDFAKLAEEAYRGFQGNLTVMIPVFPSSALDPRDLSQSMRPMEPASAIGDLGASGWEGIALASNCSMTCVILARRGRVAEGLRRVAEFLATKTQDTGQVSCPKRRWRPRLILKSLHSKEAWPAQT